MVDSVATALQTRRIVKTRRIAKTSRVIETRWVERMKLGRSGLAMVLIVGLTGWIGRPSSDASAGEAFGRGESGKLVTPMAASDHVIGFCSVLGDGSQTLTLVNTEKLHITVYHVGSDGTIELRSSRPIDADFTLQLNATAPLPDQIRRLNQ